MDDEDAFWVSMGRHIGERLMWRGAKSQSKFIGAGAYLSEF